LITPTIVCVATLCAHTFTGSLKPVQSTAKPAAAVAASAGQLISKVRTTAYTHTEADHVQYGPRTAVGTRLNAGKIRSAAADWSIFPLGTVFQIKGDSSSIYVVDDYGSALVGTRTIDIYQPTTSLMNRWGTRHVDIQIVRWGSLSKSLAVLKPRAYKASHVREMITRIQARS